MSWFTDHYAEVESKCNEPRYVDACVKQQSIPGKFRQELVGFGVGFKESPLDGNGCKVFDYEKFTESGVPVILPDGWKIVSAKKNNVLELRNEENCVVFAICVNDNRGYQTWSKVQ